MQPAFALTITAAAALLLIVSSRRAQGYTSQAEEDAPTIADELGAIASEAVNLIDPTPAADMAPSDQLLAMLEQSEGLRLERYRLGDGGWTIGFGRYYPDGGTLPPASIDLATAQAWFAEDVEARAARWVRAYVSAPLQQAQFDALVSMAYNLSPKAFRTIAAAVNAGDDPEGAALQFVRAGSSLEAGLRNRRARELTLYRTGIYA